MAADTSGFGEGVELSGFRGIDEAAMEDIQRVVRSYLKRYGEICPKFQKLMLKMKKVHAQVHSEKYEIHASVLYKGKMYSSKMTELDLIAAVDTALKKLENELGGK